MSSSNITSEIFKLEHIGLIKIICNITNQCIDINDNDLSEYIINIYNQCKSSYNKFKQELQNNDDDNLFDDKLCNILYNAINSVLNRQNNIKSNNNVTKQQLTTDDTLRQEQKQQQQQLSTTVKQHSQSKQQSTATNNIHPSRLAQIDADNSIKQQDNKIYDDKHTIEQQQYNDDKQQYSRYNNDRYSNNKHNHSNNTVRMSKNDLLIGTILDGRITKITNFGCFIELNNVEPTTEGLCHISQISKDRIADINNIVKRNQNVKCKIIHITGSKIGLSIKDVDQITGQDLNASNNTNKQQYNNVNNNNNNNRQQNNDLVYNTNRNAHLNEQERWEINQLRKQGLLKNDIVSNNSSDSNVVNKLHNNNDTNDLTTVLKQQYSKPVELDDDNVEQHIQIELNDEKPIFLQKSYELLDNDVDNNISDTTKLLRAPDGSMARVALTQSALQKEKQELKRINQQTNNDNVDYNTKTHILNDPLAKQKINSINQINDINKLNNNNKNISNWKLKQMLHNITYGRITDQTIIQQRQELPIYKLKDQFLQAISENNILVVIGETGSGKTTQMTQYLYEAGFVSDKQQIACTQPRRVAAVSVAKRVAEEMNCDVGQTVGYSIRFDDCTSSDTAIKYMTDGMLLREFLIDKNLSKYNVIMLDEAHERTINTDILFGLLKSLTQRRKDLKLIVTSATLDADKFSEYFNSAPIFTIPGRMYPVTILYAKQIELDYIENSLNTAMQIHLTEAEGDILLFLTGRDEIDNACEVLYDRIQQLGTTCPPLHILPVYSALPTEIQSQIFEPTPPGHRKCIIATNIAEASITLPGIVYVIDPGFVKQKIYNQTWNIETLTVVPISQASANQRAGRAGRVKPGKCYRLYTEHAFIYEMMKQTIPEIQRVNLNMIVLQLKAYGIHDILSFPFMDQPDMRQIVSALQNLYTLNVLDSEGFLTKLGIRMSEFPLDPNLSKILIYSCELQCSQEMLSIVSMLSVESVYVRPREHTQQADNKHSKYYAVEGDHITLLNIYNTWVKANMSATFCRDNYFHFRVLKQAYDIRQQLQSLMERYNMNMVSCNNNISLVQKCICSGFFMNVAKRDNTSAQTQGTYKTVVNQQSVYIHPSSSLYYRQPEWLCYNTLLMTTREYIHNVLSIKPQWLIEVAPQFYTQPTQGQISRMKKRERVEPLYDRFAQNQNAWRLSKRRG